jgi:hypothetical protein
LVKALVIAGEISAKAGSAVQATTAATAEAENERSSEETRDHGGSSARARHTGIPAG